MLVQNDAKAKGVLSHPVRNVKQIYTREVNLHEAKQETQALLVLDL